MRNEPRRASRARCSSLPAVPHTASASGPLTSGRKLVSTSSRRTRGSCWSSTSSMRNSPIDPESRASPVSTWPVFSEPSRRSAHSRTPATHPSVRAISSSRSPSDTATPCSASNSRASAAVIARSAARSSHSRPAARVLGEGDQRIAAGRQHEPQPIAGAPRKDVHPVDDVRPREEMRVVEHHGRTLGRRRRGDLRRPQRGQVRSRDAERSHGIEEPGPEPARLVIRRRQGHPGSPAAPGLRPLTEQHRLPRTRTGGEQRERGAGVLQHGDQARARHRPGGQLRNRETGISAGDYGALPLAARASRAARLRPRVSHASAGLLITSPPRGDTARATPPPTGSPAVEEEPGCVSMDDAAWPSPARRPGGWEVCRMADSGPDHGRPSARAAGGTAPPVPEQLPASGPGKAEETAYDVPRRVPEQPRPSDEAQSPRGPGRRVRFTLPGAWAALIFTCLAFTPSLLPRSGLVQGVACGITAAIGYGLGVLAAAVWRAFPDRPPRPARPLAWRVFLVVAVVALAVSVTFGQIWQNQLRNLMGADGPGVISYVLFPLIAVALFVGLVWLARALRAAYRLVVRVLRRFIGPRAARGLGWAVVVAGTVLLVNGVLLNALADAADRSFALRNDTSFAGVVPPTSPLRSGGPGSLAPWDTLGREGARLVAGGQDAAQIGRFLRAPAKEPIRVYVGRETAPSIEEQAELAVAELQRTRAFDRRYLVIANTTGSGWVNAGMANTVEYLTGGDSAVVAIQYSYLPSWISYLVDQRKAREAGRELFDAVYADWSSLPPDRRPRLLVSGESLGSFGGEAAFSGAYDLRNRTSGVLFTGPPNFNVLHREFTDDRDPGTPEVQPVYRRGRTVRFSNEIANGAPPEGEPWEGTRVLYLQHPSDPIVWWSSRLALHKPDWLRERRGRDVLPQMRWIPIVTFAQVAADVPVATAVPAGHGHNYTPEYVDGWADVLRPSGWSPAKADELRRLVAR